MLYVHVHDILPSIRSFTDFPDLGLYICTNDLDLSATPLRCNIYVVSILHDHVCWFHLDISFDRSGILANLFN
jgi:hypothetical protein